MIGKNEIRDFILQECDTCLHLYAKQAGNAEIWTPDCWVGTSMERPAPATTTEA